MSIFRDFIFERISLTSVETCLYDRKESTTFKIEDVIYKSVAGNRLIC
jgi:hypothetical protein